jgi:two-component system nitrate/nitrite response regulator NarL
MNPAPDHRTPDSSGTPPIAPARDASPASIRTENPIRILLVDDHPVVRKGLMTCFAVRSNFLVVGEAADGLEALRKVDELRPDLVLMDIEMPKMDGLTAAATIANEFRGIQVLMLSTHYNIEQTMRAVQAGARGLVPKSLSSAELIKAIEIVQRGEPFFPGQTELPAQTSSPGKKSVELFEREKQVLVYLATGYNNKEIALLIGISVRTVESHRARLMNKVNIHTIAGLTRYALEHRFISLNPSFALPVTEKRVKLLSSPPPDNCL